MRFIRRKKKEEEQELCCPICRERLPEDATVCRMCGERVPLYLVKERGAAPEIAGERSANG